MKDHALSRLQLDILELESRFWRHDGSKITEFRRRYPRVTETGYYVALGRLLQDERAYLYAGGRYAAMLHRIARAKDDAEVMRTTGRTP